MSETISLLAPRTWEPCEWQANRKNCRLSRYRWNILASLVSARYDGKTLARHSLRRVLNYTSVARRTNTNKAFNFLFTSWTLSWSAVQSQAGLSPSAWGQVHLTSQLYRPAPLTRTMMMMMQLRTSVTICRKSWTSPWERHPCCVRRLECQCRRECIQKLERHLWTLLQPRDKRERSKASGVCLRQRSCAGEYTWQTQSIQKMDMAQSKWRIP